MTQTDDTTSTGTEPAIGTKEQFIQLLMKEHGIERTAEGFAALYKTIELFKGQLFAELALKYEPHSDGIPGCACGDEEGTATTLTLEAQIMTGTISDLVYDTGTGKLRMSEKSQKWSDRDGKLRVEEITSPFDQLKAEHCYKSNSQEDGAVVWNGYLPVSFMKHGGHSEILIMRVGQRKGTSGDARAILIGTNNVLAAFGLEGVEGISTPESLYSAFTLQCHSDAAKMEEGVPTEEQKKYYLNSPLADVVQRFFKETIFSWFEIEKPHNYGRMNLEY